MRSITEIVRQFKLNWTEELNPRNIARACRDSGMSWIESALNPVVTIQILMIQVLHGNTAISHLPHLTKMVFTAAGYCTARMRIELRAMQLLLERSVEQVQGQTLDAARWLGHRVFMVDGSSFSMSDTPALQSHFGQPGAQKPGCGFPVVHWLVMMHLGTGMITKMLAAPLRTGDMSGTVELHPELKRGDVLVADRAFCSFAHLCLLIERGVDAVMRVHQQMIVDFTPGRPYVIPHQGTGSKRKGLPRSRWIKRLGVSDQIVAWQKNTRGKPRWMSAEQFALLPLEITVREIRYTIAQKGFRSKEITLVTTLLDAELYSLPALADLYRQRWAIETSFGHIKTTMNMDILKCQTVDGVLRELHAFALVYNLIRQVMVEASIRQKVAVWRISFVDALRWIKEAALDEPLSKLVVNPDRPDRYEPRVRKRRPKKYKLMTEPRNILKQRLAGK